MGFWYGQDGVKTDDERDQPDNGTSVNYIQRWFERLITQGHWNQEGTYHIRYGCGSRSAEVGAKLFSANGHEHSPVAIPEAQAQAERIENQGTFNTEV